MSALAELVVDQNHDIADGVSRIRTGLRAENSLKAGEGALDQIAKLLDLPWAYWVPDTSHPYQMPEADAYARANGWPDELLTMWWNRHAALKMPIYIRCRFENLPFVVPLDQKRHRNLTRTSPEVARVTALIRNMGVTTLLVLPLHLAKGRVAMIAWAGNRPANEITDIVAGIEGDLLAIGYYFMRIACHAIEGRQDAMDERSRLTPREWDCARTLAQGYREAEIAELIGIKKVTVRFHLDNVVEKFGCKTRTQAVALLAQLGLLGPIGT